MTIESGVFGTPFLQQALIDSGKQQVLGSAPGKQMTALDQSYQAAAPLQDASSALLNPNTLSGYTNALNQPLQPLQGYGTLLPGALQKYATAAGVQDPFSAWQNSDPYALQDEQQKQLNQQMDLLNQQRQNAQADLAQSLTERGITPDSPAWQSAHDRLEQNYNQAVDTHRTNFLEQARQNHQNAYQYLTSALTGLQQMQAQQKQAAINQALQPINTGASLLGQYLSTLQNQAAQYGQIAARNQAQSNYNQSNLFGILGSVAGAVTGLPGIGLLTGGLAGSNNNSGVNLSQIPYGDNVATGLVLP